MSLNLYTLPLTQSILCHVTDHLIRQGTKDPLALSQIQILLPNRRAVRELKHRLLEKAPQTTLFLPKIQAIGDLKPPLGEVILPEIPTPLRFALLLRLLKEETFSYDLRNPIELAKNLCSFLDYLQSEDVTISTLSTFIPETLSEHWQRTLDFLMIFEEKWKLLLKDQGYLEANARRNAIWDAIADDWGCSSPSNPIIAAGITPASFTIGRLLKIIAHLPQGQVILPGFDTSLTSKEWETLKSSHPQYLYKRCFERLKLDPKVVKFWPKLSSGLTERDRLITNMMHSELPQDHLSLEGITTVDLATPQEEAEVIAILTREALEVPAKKVVIITPDRQLSKRIRYALRRWKIELDDSAGTPLLTTPPGQFFLLTADLQHFKDNPIQTLAVMKHPFTHLGFARHELLKCARALEMQILRSPKDAKDINTSILSRINRQADPLLREILQTLIHKWDEVTARFLILKDKTEVPFKQILQEHLELIDGLRQTTSEDHDVLEDERESEMKTIIKGLFEHSHLFGTIKSSDYPYLLKAILANATHYSPFSHSRVTLLAPTQMRLIDADLVILSGLNEGMWPQRPCMYPWLNRAMQVAIGLPEPEAKIGQEGLDISFGLAQKEVVLTRAQQVDGSPTSASRWLLRLRAIATRQDDNLSHPHPHNLWCQHIDQPTSYIKIEEPRPQIPVEIRPQRLSISDIELLLKARYEFYARRILNLKPREAVKATFTPRIFGSVLHQILEHNATADELLLVTFPQTAEPVWHYQFEKIRTWLLQCEDFRDQKEQIMTEVQISLMYRGLEFIGKADRLHIKEDGLEVIDFKTGSIPTTKDLKKGYAPQLPLLGFLLQMSKNTRVLKLSYWDLKNREIRSLEDPDQMISQYENILNQLIDTYRQQEMIFQVMPYVNKHWQLSQYHHLERAKEWMNNLI